MLSNPPAPPPWLPQNPKPRKNVFEVDVVENVFLTKSTHTCMSELIIGAIFSSSESTA
jgi:hypothetical protein